jgi:hypothetical protein
MGLPLSPLKPMVLSQLSDKSHQGSLSGFKYFNPLILKNLVMAIPRFIQIGVPLPPLKPMAQSRRGVGFLRLPMTYDRDSEIMQHATLSNH